MKLKFSGVATNNEGKSLKRWVKLTNVKFYWAIAQIVLRIFVSNNYNFANPRRNELFLEQCIQIIFSVSVISSINFLVYECYSYIFI